MTFWHPASAVRSLLILGILATAGAADRPAKPGEAPPNIIMILVDDLGYGDLRCYNPACDNPTPNVDKLAAEGTRFTNFYVSSSVCSPSRASILSGCYHRRIGIDHVLWPASMSGLNPKEVTIAEMLRERGYATCYLGKWHVGDQVAFLPTRQGFDTYFGLPYSHDMPTLMVRKTEETVLPVKIRALPLYRDEKPIALVTNVRGLTKRYHEEALACISAQHEAKRPFFIFLAHNAIHLPMQPSKEFRNESGAGALGDWLEEVDSGLGAILTRLKELKIDEQTLIVFFSDNGPAKRANGSAGELRGGKHSTWEGGLKVPFIIRWPGHVPAGKVNAQLAGGMDLLPSIATFAGAKVDFQQIDGLDLSQLFLGKTEISPRKDFYYYDSGRLAAVRDTRWKLHMRGPDEEPRMLYDLENDPGETKDVTSLHPDVVARLSAMGEEAARLLGNGSQKGVLERPEGKVSRLTPISRALPLMRGESGEGEAPKAPAAEASPEPEPQKTTPAKRQ
jgi:arylsulfatase